MIEWLTAERSYNPAQPRDSYGKWSSDSLETIADSMREKHPSIDFDFTGCDPDVAARTAKQYDELLQKYPDVTKTIAYIGTPEWAPDGWAPNFSERKGAIATCSSNLNNLNHNFKNVITLNPKYYGDPQFLQDALDRSQTWMASSSLEGLATHEFGHAIHFYLLREGAKKSFTGYIGLSAQGEVRQTISDFTSYNHSLSGKTSRYAATNEYEAFAEGFTMAYHRPADKQSAYAKGLNNLLGQLLPNGLSKGWSNVTPTKLTPEQREQWDAFDRKYIAIN